MSEKLTNQNPEARENANSLEQAGHELREALQQSHELADREPNRSERFEQTARQEALEQAARTQERIQTEDAKIEAPKKRSRPGKKELDVSFKQTMKQIQSEMSPADRAFSKVIHNPVVDKVSSVAGSTVARPNLILAGALGTIILCSVIYLVAKFYGYPLSGTEAIATFIIGWAIGAIIEYIRVGFSNRRHTPSV